MGMYILCKTQNFSCNDAFHSITIWSYFTPYKLMVHLFDISIKPVKPQTLFMLILSNNTHRNTGCALPTPLYVFMRVFYQKWQINKIRMPVRGLAGLVLCVRMLNAHK